MYHIELIANKKAKLQPTRGGEKMLELKHDYYIGANNRCFRLLKDTKKKNDKNQKIYKIIGYYSSIEETLQAYVNDNLQNSVAEKDMNIAQLLKELSDLKKEIQDMFSALPKTAKKKTDVEEVEDEEKDEDAPIDIEIKPDSLEYD